MATLKSLTTQPKSTENESTVSLSSGSSESFRTTFLEQANEIFNDITLKIREINSLLSNDEIVETLHEMKEHGQLSERAYKLLLKKVLDGSNETARLDGAIDKEDLRFMARVIDELTSSGNENTSTLIDNALLKGGVAAVRQLFESGRLNDALYESTISSERAQLIFEAFTGNEEALVRLENDNRDRSLNMREYAIKSENGINTGLYTGESAYIGGSSAYHIDIKFRTELTLEQRIRMMDQLAITYAQEGRLIEFSNEGVAGEQWVTSRSKDEKKALLQRVEAAHRHSQHNGWTSIDYYIPFAGENRGNPTAVDNAEIALPRVDGTSIQFNSAGNYGHYAEMTDASGRVLVKTGHGDNSRSLPRSFVV